MVDRKLNKTCVFIVPFFGKFKESFSLFLTSCRYNSDVTWLIITDNDQPKELPVNVQWQTCSFVDFRDKIQSKFDFKISLEKPYKLCDFKPCYGFILEDELCKYDYWGYCDVDIILGNLNKFLSPLMNSGYDKIFAAGHMTLYRNCEEVNRAFMLPNSYGTYLYKIAFSNPNIYVFDEVYLSQNIHQIFVDNGFHTYAADLSFNISLDYYHLRKKPLIASTKRWVNEPHTVQELYWENGKVYSISNHQRQEYVYVHLQARFPAIERNILKKRKWYIHPNAISSRRRIGVMYKLETYKIKQYHLLLHFIKQYVKHPRMAIDNHPEEINPYTEKY